MKALKKPKSKLHEKTTESLKKTKSTDQQPEKEPNSVDGNKLKPKKKEKKNTKVISKPISKDEGVLNSEIETKMDFNSFIFQNNFSLGNITDWKTYATLYQHMATYDSKREHKLKHHSGISHCDGALVWPLLFLVPSHKLARVGIGNGMGWLEQLLLFVLVGS